MKRNTQIKNIKAYYKCSGCGSISVITDGEPFTCPPGFKRRYFGNTDFRSIPRLTNVQHCTRCPKPKKYPEF